MPPQIQAPANDSGVPTSQLAVPEGLPHRTRVGLCLLVVVTVAALAVAWCWPDRTALHFWLVAQALPVFYAVLAWWWAREPLEAEHEL